MEQCWRLPVTALFTGGLVLFAGVALCAADAVAQSLHIDVGATKDYTAADGAIWQADHGFTVI